jgi:hypothetical protein
MVKVYIHIGTPKTGTSSIQKFLFDNRKILLEKGYLYSAYGRAGSKLQASISVAALFSHHNLVWELTKATVYDPKAGGWKEILGEIKHLKAKNVVISSEFFYGIVDYDKLISLKDLLGCETKIIVYLRRQDQYFQSLYSQAIKMGRPHESITQYILANKFKCDYYKLLEPWRKTFGQENIIVRVFDKKQLKGGVIQDFLETINVNMDKVEIEKFQSENITTNLKVIKVLEFLNKIAINKISISQNKWKKLALAIANPHNKISEIIAKLPNFLISDQLLTLQERIDLLKEFEESNRKVAYEYLGREDGKLFDSSLE